MCSPTLVMAGVGAALSGGQMYAQQKQAEAIGAQQAANAITASNFRQADLNAQAVEENRQATQEANASEIEAARVASSVRTQSGEAGIAGTGVNRLLGDVGRQAAERLAIGSSNLRGNLSNINMQKDRDSMNLASTLEGINRSTEAPSALSQILTIGSGAVSGYSMGNNFFGSASFSEGKDALKQLFTDPENFISPAEQQRLSRLTAASKV